MGELLANRIRGAVGAGLLVAAAATLLWACLQPPLALSGGGEDGSSDGSSAILDGGGSAILGLFTISGCKELSFSLPSTGLDLEPQCSGVAPLRVRLVLLAVGATTHRFQLMRDVQPRDGGTQDGDAGILPDGGSDSLLDEASSHAVAPEVLLSVPGTYRVSLGVAGPGGTAAAAGVIIVQPARLGAACDSDIQCASGLRCLCGQGASDGSCPAGLSAGMCTQSCDAMACPADSVCLDLSRSAVPQNVDGGAASDAWRRPICVPSCKGNADCRGDLSCRELPLLQAAAPAGGPYTWGRACFAGTPGGVGQSCIGGDEKPSPSACALGLCETLGLRDLCTAPCDVNCPSSAACAVWNGPAPPAPAGARCLLRCDALQPCGDPLLDCLPAGASGALGFKLPTEPAGTMVCAPRRCTSFADCLGGQCVALGGASFCTR